MSKLQQTFISFFIKHRVISAIAGVILGLGLLTGGYRVYHHWFGSQRQAVHYGRSGPGQLEPGMGNLPIAEAGSPTGPNQTAGEASDTQPEIPPLPAEELTNRFTVLLVGLDRRPGETSIGNTDTLIVAQVDPDTGRIALMSVPRDTQVVIPAHGENKINAAARLGGGLAATRSILEKLLGQRIDGYVLANFYGFKRIVDDLGGITLDVETDMHYNTGDGEDGIINLHKGLQRLNGTQTLQYVRFRNDAMADIGRTQRQQKVLKAMGQEFMQLKTLPKLPWLIPEMYNTIETDLPLRKLLVMANFGVRGDPGKIISQTLPGDFLIEKGISYWKVRPEECRQVATKLFRDGKTSELFSRQVTVVNDQPAATASAESKSIDQQAVKSASPATGKYAVISDSNNSQTGKDESSYSPNRDLERIEAGISVEVQNLP